MKRLALAAMLASAGCNQKIDVYRGVTHHDRIDLPRKLEYRGYEVTVTGGVWEVKITYKETNDDM